MYSGDCMNFNDFFLLHVIITVSSSALANHASWVSWVSIY